MFDFLAQIGIDKGQGIFFFLFLVACAGAIWLYKSNEKSKNVLVESIMDTNDEREKRYLGTIDKLAEIHDVKNELIELRKDVLNANDRQEQMLGRLLDRFPVGR